MENFFRNLLNEYTDRLRWLPDLIAAMTISLIQAILVLLVTLWIAERIRLIIKKLLGQNRVNPNVRGLIGRLAYLAVLTIGLVAVLQIFGVEPATIVTVIGVFGLAASLAAQDILKNFFSGLYLLIERPFYIGDRVTVDKWTGTIEDVGFRVTKIHTDDDEMVFVPNAVIFSSALVNQARTRKAPISPDAASSTKAVSVVSTESEPRAKPLED